MSVKSLLGRTTLFGELSADDLDLLAAYSRPFRIQPGEALFRRGQRTDSVYLIDEGRFDVVARSVNGMAVVGSVGAGEVTGEMALLSGEPRSATLIATEPTSGVALGKDVIDSLRRSPRPGGLAISRHLVDIACSRIRRRFTELSGDRTQGSELKPMPAEPTKPEYQRHLKTLPWFSALGYGLAAILDAGRWWSVKRGSVLVVEGSNPSGIYVPAHGALEELLDAGERRYRVRLAGPGRAAGNLGTLDDGGSPTTVRALERAIVFELPKRMVRDIIKSSGRATRALLTALTEDLAGASAAANSPHHWEIR